MTVGELKRAIAGLPDSYPVYLFHGRKNYLHFVYSCNTRKALHIPTKRKKDWKTGLPIFEGYGIDIYDPKKGKFRCDTIVECAMIDF